MAESRTVHRLQIAANIAVIVACASVGWLALRRAVQPTASPPTTYAVGDRIDAVQGVDFGGSPRTLVMALRQDCRYCQASIPFYRRLRSAVGDSTAERVRLVVVSTDSAASLAAYLSDAGVRVDQVAEMQPQTLKIPGTPMLFLVDRTGKVTGVWRGKLAEAQERDLLAAIALQ